MKHKRLKTVLKVLFPIALVFVLMVMVMRLLVYGITNGD